MLVGDKEKRKHSPAARLRSFTVAVLSVVAASLLALLLEHWIRNTNLVLVYVLAVIFVGLRYGSFQAVIASVLSFLSFNFLLTEPRYTLAVERQEELVTLIFLLLIALVCGPAASRIRRQFMLLRAANRYSEAMRSLSQALSIAENPEAVWQVTSIELASALQAEACIAIPDGGDYTLFPQGVDVLGSTGRAALEWTRKHGVHCGRLPDAHNTTAWTIFPVLKGQTCMAYALVRINPAVSLSRYDTDLIQSMLQQAADSAQRVQLMSDLESARVKTEVEQLRSALLSSVSHDLKSPLAAMMGAAESLLLLEKQLDAQDHAELVDTILQESRRLDSYIQNLLDMTRLGHGDLKIERDWVSVADIVGSALGRIKRYYPGVRAETRFPGSTPVLYVHAALIEQAIFNILENAAKFTAADEAILITVAAKKGRCLISVEDNGPGIPELLREKVFDMFYVVADGDKKSQGTGMGLAICRGMIAAHRGSVYVTEGTDHKGTRIVIDIPVEQTDRDGTATEEVQKP